MVTAVIIAVAGLGVCCALVFRHACRNAPLCDEQERPVPSVHRQAVIRDGERIVHQEPSLLREQRRQRPWEGRN